MKKYFADYIFISVLRDPPFIENGVLTVDEKTGKILDVSQISRRSADKAKKPLPRVKGFKTLLVPGFINSHMHTDISFRPSRNTPRIFSKWVISLIGKRKAMSPAKKDSLRHKAFADSVKSGVTAIGDIIDPDGFYGSELISAGTAAAAMMPRVKGFFEIRGLNPADAAEKASDIKNFLNRTEKVFKKSEKFFSPGLSPHAIYSVSPELFGLIRGLDSRLNLRIAIHAGEHRSETEFISGRGGDIAENLIPALVSPEFSFPRVKFSSPPEYLKSLRMLDNKTLLIHANELDGEALDIIKESGASIIHCPRSNDFFGSGRFPFAEAVKKGISVAIGTDGLYSNSSLSMLDELRYARKIHTGARPRDLVAAATVNGAKALSFPGVTGTLEPGSFADFTFFRLKKDLNRDSGGVFGTILKFTKNDVAAVAVGGNLIYEAAGPVGGPVL